MANHELDHADEAFTLIEKLDGIRDAEGVVDAVAESLSRFGFESFIITGLPHLDERIEQLVLLRRWPEGWFEIYSQEEYVRVDPVVRMCRGTVRPFEWSEAPYNPDREPRAAEVMRRATDFRMVRGFCLPIHGPQGYEACVSMSGTNLDLTARTKPALHLMAMYAFERARQILRPDRLPRSAGLTPREREILTWAAQGKSAAETGMILGITERTVTAHIVNACQKLGASNKTQAVARAMQHRAITI